MYSDNEINPFDPMEKFYFENCKDGYQGLNTQNNRNLGPYQMSQNLQSADGDFASAITPVTYISNGNNTESPEIMSWHSSAATENMHFSNCQNNHDYKSAPQYYNQVQVLKTQQSAMKLSEFLILKPCQNNDVMGKMHRAHISLVPTSTGMKTIVKRKRKRTMFTTEQIETLEEIFKSKPYINRDDRQVLVQKLQVSDKSVKVWFQNRRLKGKRNEQTTLEELREEGKSPDLARLDYVESQINEKTDEFGYVTLDDKVMSDLVNVIDNFLSDSCRLKVRSNDRSDTLTNAGSNPIYEPISPASVTGCISEEENGHQWKPNEPKESLQRLFDLQYLVPF